MLRGRGVVLCVSLCVCVCSFPPHIMKHCFANFIVTTKTERVLRAAERCFCTHCLHSPLREKEKEREREREIDKRERKRDSDRGVAVSSGEVWGRKHISGLQEGLLRVTRVWKEKSILLLFRV